MEYLPQSDPYSFVGTVVVSVVVVVVVGWLELRIRRDKRARHAE